MSANTPRENEGNTEGVSDLCLPQTPEVHAEDYPNMDLPIRFSSRKAKNVNVSGDTFETYGHKKIDESQLRSMLRRLPPNPRVFTSGNFATPYQVLSVVDEELETYTVHALNPQKGFVDREGVVWETCFVGGGMRKPSKASLRYIPARLSLVPSLLMNQLKPDVAIVQTTPAKNGRVSLGIETNVVPAAIDATRANGGKVIGVVNPNMPYTFGDAEIDCTMFDAMFDMPVELPSAQPVTLKPGSVFEQIGGHVAEFIGNGSTLQMGIGSIPDAVLSHLDAKNLSIYTEMFSDGVLELERKGMLNPDSKIVGSFAFGSPEFYWWLDRNVNVRMLRTEVTNDPGRISARPLMMSINAGLQADLYSQVNASWVGNKIYSGFGGSTDFIVGALHSPGGKAIVGLPSWHEKSGQSTILPRLTTPATSFQHSYLVTENGAAEVYGNSLAEQALNIIENAAHPDAREFLHQAATERGLLH